MFLMNLWSNSRLLEKLRNYSVNQLRYPLGFILFFLFLNSGCGEFKSSNTFVAGLNNRISATYIGPAEPSYCVGPTIYTSFYTITGTAQYQYRKLEYTAQFKGLGDVANIPKPIRFAEYVVLNNFGNIIQCGETNALGDFSFTVPNNGQVFRLQVRSRADNNFYKVSVLRSPESNQIYHVESAFSASSNQSLNLTAPAVGSVLGGAFNILDQIFDYNEKIGTLLGNSAFVAPKVKVFWEKGFNPGSYYSGDPISSFYIKDTGRLFILGGVSGDVNYSDTDHFDNSIIAHEYFHFLEDSFSVTNSPGGSHNGNQLLDPRLAWSEGVAQYFQAVMTDISRVLDTVGNLDGASNLIVNYSVELTENDIPIYNGEGEFREFSIARLLWDAFDDTPGEAQAATVCSNMTSAIDAVHDKCASGGFADFWSVITNTSTFSNPTYKFRSGGLFHQHQATISPGTNNNKNLQPLRSYERQAASRNRYGIRLGSCGSPQTYSMTGPFISNQSGQFINNHPVANRRHLYFEHLGTSFALRFSATFAGTLTADPDIYLFSENYILGSSTPIALDISANLSGGYFKELSVANLAPGYYMIIVDVRNFNSSSDDLNFNLQSGATLGSLTGFCSNP